MDESLSAAVEIYAAKKLEEYKHLDYAQAQTLPRATIEDVVIAGKEVQLAVFKQEELAILPGAILITVQIVRAALGGIHSFNFETGLVFEENRPVRAATNEELRLSA